MIFDRDELLTALRRAATNGVAPRLGEYEAGEHRPSGATIARRLGGWERAVHAAGLKTAAEATHERTMREAEQRATAEARKRAQREQREAARRSSSATVEGPMARRQRARREEKRAALEAEVAEGRLTIRFASAEQRAEWAREAAERRNGFRPVDPNAERLPGAEVVA